MEEVQVLIILPTSVVWGADEWSINQVDKDEQGNQQTPEGCPANQRFVPSHIRTEVLPSGHNSRVACHAGVNRTLFLLQEHFWWPSMATDTRQYTSACTRNRPPLIDLLPAYCIFFWFLSLVPNSYGFYYRTSALRRYQSTENIILVRNTYRPKHKTDE